MFEFTNFKVYRYLNDEDKYFFVIPKGNTYLAVLECLIGAKYDFAFDSFKDVYRISVDLFDQEGLSEFNSLVRWLGETFGDEK